MNLKIILFLFTILSYSQESIVNKNIKGVQIGVYGSWFYHETELNNNFVLRNEIGLDTGFGKTFLIVNPSIAFEPKWYYNKNKRKLRGKNTHRNSANFLSLQTKYYFDNIGSEKLERKSLNQNKILKSNLTWGIRRSFSNRFDYETGIGFGAQRNFEKNEFEPSINIHLRIGIGW